MGKQNEQAKPKRSFVTIIRSKPSNQLFAIKLDWESDELTILLEWHFPFYFYNLHK